MIHMNSADMDETGSIGNRIAIPWRSKNMRSHVVMTFGAVLRFIAKLKEGVYIIYIECIQFFIVSWYRLSKPVPHKAL